MIGPLRQFEHLTISLMVIVVIIVVVISSDGDYTGSQFKPPATLW